MSWLLRYVIKRVLWLIPIIICVSFVVYGLLELAPGTIVDAMISESMTPEDVAALRAKYDLDKPMVYRYGKYMLHLVSGDLGVSDVSGISVWNTYISRLPNTLILALAALIIGTSISIPLGIVAARRAGTLVDTATTTFTLIGISMPGFWLGLLLLLVFSFWLGWLPGGGNRNGFRSIILPAVCSGLLLMATATRQTRSSMLEVLSSDYLRTARAKGVPEDVVIRKHALGNAWIPILTTIGSSVCVSLAGSAVVESVFAWPGVGRMTVEAVLTRDVTTTAGCVIMTSILYVIVQLIIDLLYAFVDPRIKSRYFNAGKKRKQADAEAPGRVAAPLLMPTEEFAGEPQKPAVEGTAVSYTVVPQEEPVQAGIPEEASLEPETDSQREQQDRSCSGDGIEKTDRVSDSAELIVKKYKKRSMINDLFHRIWQNKGARAGLIILGLLITLLIISLFISFEMVTVNNVKVRFTSPNWQFPFGTDNMGRNAFLRVIYGTRYSLVIGLGTVAIAAFFGISLGSIAGYFGNVADDIIMRASDVLASIPGLLLGMVIVTVLGQSLQNLIIAVGIQSIPVYLRITRASILTVRNQEFVEAARAIGLSNARIIFTQVLPNGLSPIIVTVTASLGLSIIVAASLSFLGFGVQVPHPEWGALISAGRDFARSAPWLMTFPGLFIMVTVLAFNLLGDGLRDALDPKLKR